MTVDAHMHLIEHIATFGGKGEGRPIGNGKMRLATGEEIQLIPKGMGEYGYSGETCIKLMNQYNIEVSVLLQSGFYGFHNEYVVEMAEKYPGRFYPVGGVDPFCNEKTKIIDNLIKNLGIRALKFETSQAVGIASYHPGFKIDGPEMQEIYEAAHKYDMTIVFDVGGPEQESYQVEAWRRVLDQYRDVRFVVCHLLVPKKRNQPNWEEEIKMLSTENAWFDFAALPFNIPEPYPFNISIEHIEKVAKIAGTNKLLWGSDCPFVLSYNSYENLLNYVRHSKIFSESDIEKLLGNNAIEAYNISF